MEGMQDRIGDLSWLGESFIDQGWVQVEGEAVSEASPETKAETEWSNAKEHLRQSDWSMLPDVPMTVSDKEAWLQYRDSLRNIREQSHFPEAIVWPNKPE
jgi:hypothetical protein